ncbi:MAG TPA: malto-oligosyltrehalose synthase [Methylomirabilota bacterium]|nr:malto-oligosyltrehalose synthase [Methylomirabilota bacterium]
MTEADPHRPAVPAAAPRATYRLQLGPGFGFAEVAALAPYLAELGVSHIHLSPCLQAAEGSSHGYDVVDPTRVSDALGGPEGFAAMCDELDRHGLGRVLDVVPNHMATRGRENPWWWSVLENGPASPYARYFDVDWDPPEAWLRNKVLLPVLGDHYGRELEAGRIALEHDAGELVVRYGDQVFPVAPRSLAQILDAAADRSSSATLAFYADAHRALPEATVTEREALERRDRDRAVLGRLLRALVAERPEVEAALDATAAAVNADPDSLHDLLEAQNYRLAYWHAARRDLDYRRFFDIHDLVGLRVEDEDVFHDSHRLVLEWVRSGRVHGLRVDHPDGLRDPAGYLRRLREHCGDRLIVVEKILVGDERLPANWEVDGSTGYDFLNLATRLLVDGAGEAPLTRLWHDLSGDPKPWQEVVLESKELVLRDILDSEVNRLSALFVQVCERHRRHRDHSRHELREALIATAACFPVYRSYIADGEVPPSASDLRHIRRAVTAAGERRPDLEPALLELLARLLSRLVDGELECELAVRFQQLTGAAMAKGMEDTAMYRWAPLLALNEVGGEPDHFGVSPEEFHRSCAETARRWPRTMLATSTHDTKRSEDVRARLAVLAEVPDRWRETVGRLSALAERHRSRGRPDPGTEALIWQTLVGAWPIGAERLLAYLEKAVREAKVHTSWTRVDAAWEEAVRDFAVAVLADPGLTDEIAAFVESVAEPARANSLALKLLALTAPGVPDLYQGTELGDFSLVDPDNRRPVDFAARRRLLDRLDRDGAEAAAGDDLDAAKLWLVRQVLAVRRRRPEAFGPGGGYEPVASDGPRRDHLVGFVRGGAVATLVTRLPVGLGGSWGDTTVSLPEGTWRDLLTDAETAGGEVRAAVLLDRFPVALLEREPSP